MQLLNIPDKISIPVALVNLLKFFKNTDVYYAGCNKKIARV